MGYTHYYTIQDITKPLRTSDIAQDISPRTFRASSWHPRSPSGTGATAGTASPSWNTTWCA